LKMFNNAKYLKILLNYGNFYIFGAINFARSELNEGNQMSPKDYTNFSNRFRMTLSTRE
jgi:hypothetical protein